MVGGGAASFWWAWRIPPGSSSLSEASLELLEEEEEEEERELEDNLGLFCTGGPPTAADGGSGVGLALERSGLSPPSTPSEELTSARPLPPPTPPCLG